MRTRKNKMVRLILGTGLAALLHAPIVFAIPVWSFSLLPGGGNISGPAGAAIGWGYTINNPDTVNSLWLTSVVADPFLNGTPDGSFFDYPVVAPNTTITVPYGTVARTGFYALTWDTTAPAGFINGGTFTVSADWYDAGGNFLRAAPDQSAAYSATVAAVPVPAAVWLFGSGLLGLIGVARRGTGSIS